MNGGDRSMRIIPFFLGWHWSIVVVYGHYKVSSFRDLCFHDDGPWGPLLFESVLSAWKNQHDIIPFAAYEGALFQ